MNESLRIEKIFNEEDIENISMSSNPILIVYDTYYNYLLRATGKILLDSNMIMAISEFHVSNLMFLKENFTFPPTINCKILNILSLLLSLREEDTKPSDSNSHQSQSNLDRDKLRKNSIKIGAIGSLSSQEPPQIELPKEIDFSSICNQKIHQIKNAFIQAKLIKLEKKYEKTMDIKGDKPYYLKPIEVQAIMDYLNLFYFSNIKLYYHFINIEKITNNKRIDVIINKPLAVPPLHLALLQPPDKNEIDVPDEDEQKYETNVIIAFI